MPIFYIGFPRDGRKSSSNISAAACMVGDGRLLIAEFFFALKRGGRESIFYHFFLAP